MKTVTISAAEARNNLSRILSEAYFSNTTFLVTRNRKVVAEIRKPADIIKKSIKKNDKLPTRNIPIKSLDA